LEKIMEKELTGQEKVIRLVLRTLIVAAILGGGFWVARYWMKHRPSAQRRPPVHQARFVEVRELNPSAREVVVDVMGTVVPAREVGVAAEVAGRIVWVSPELVPGGRFTAGDELARIERSDYELAVAQAEASLEVARAELAQEMGQQAVALREFELLGDEEMSEEDQALVLRAPQLNMARAVVASAESALAEARLDLERTTVRAPFDCVVKERQMELGGRVNAGASLATVVGVEKYWVEVSVPIDELHWIDIPGVNAETGSDARVYDSAAWGTGEFRAGRVFRLRPDLETSGRMARLLVEVQNPLDLTVAVESRHPLVLGAYVRVEIAGKTVPNVVAVDREYVHEGNQVWIFSNDDTLDVREVEIVWSDDEKVYVDGGLRKGELLVVSDIATPVPGMKLRR
jgi:RND family efflux transporter MFP subunit